MLPLLLALLAAAPRKLAVLPVAAGEGVQPGAAAATGEAAASEARRRGRGEALAPPGFEAEEPAAVPLEVRQRLRAFTDGGGSWVLAVPYGDGDSPVFAGDGKRFWRVRVHGTFKNPNAKEWSRSFWEPRSAPGQMVPTFEGEAPALWCSGVKIPWQAAPDDQGRRMIEAATLLEPRWRRFPHAFARDDEGTHYLLDGQRKADGDPAGKDHRLWVGPKKKMVQVEVERVVEDSGGLLVLTAAGRLEARTEQDGRWAAAWIAPDGARRPLTWLDTGRSRVVIYRETSAWGGRPLGTPCDAFFAAP